MKICRFNDDRLGVVDGDVVRDVSRALAVLPPVRWPLPKSDPLIAHLDAVRAAIAHELPQAPRIALTQAVLRSPIASPGKIIAAPANYALHVSIDAQDPALNHGVHHKQLEGVDRPVDKLGLFLKASSGLVGPGEGVVINWPERRNDHEVELAVVIGREGKDIAPDAAFDFVCGYCIALDMTVRGTEDRSFRKSADSYSVLGPWLTTADDVSDPEKLMLTLTVNGALRQKSSTAAMTVKIAELIALASRAYRLYPGDVIMTGTPEGVSEVKSGDVMRAQCDELGAFEMTVR